MILRLLSRRCGCEAAPEVTCILTGTLSAQPLPVCTWPKMLVFRDARVPALRWTSCGAVVPTARLPSPVAGDYRAAGFSPIKEQAMIHPDSWRDETSIERPPPASTHTWARGHTAPRNASPLRATITLPATPDQIAEARRFVAGFVSDATLADDAMLCLSEVATNAVIHSNSCRAGGRFTVRAELHGDGCVHIEVEDQGGRWMERAKPEGQSHLGLMVVRQLASEWGIDGDGSGCRSVWFEFHPSGAGRPLSDGLVAERAEYSAGRAAG
jgi:serine/threonine-protein kinase RsbW